MNRSLAERAQHGDRVAFARIAAIVAGLVVLGSGIGLQTGLIKLPSPQTAPIPRTPTSSDLASLSPAPTPSPSTLPTADVTFTAPDGSFEVSLLDAQWKAVRGDDPTALYLERHVQGGKPTLVSIRIGDPDGRVRMCDEPALVGEGWEMERCEVTAATSVEELVDATGFPTFDGQARVLDGERAVSVHKGGYEWPARGSQFIVYVLAMHDGRPVVVRFWTGNDAGFDGYDEVLAGFRFLD